MASLGLTSVNACSSGRSDGGGDEKVSGSLSLPLEATGSSGARYRLQNAFFQIVDARTGNFVDFFATEQFPANAPEITKRLNSGEYTIQLFPGWQLLRVSEPTGGIGGMGGGIAGSGSIAGATASGGSPMMIPNPPKFRKKPPVPVPAEGGAGGDGAGGAPPVAGTSAGGSLSMGGEPSVSGGAPPIPEAGAGGTGGSTSVGVPVDAQLVSDPLQFFKIAGGDDVFVFYQFKVGGEIIDFNQGNVHVGVIVDDSEACQVPAEVTRPERVLLESHTSAMGVVSLRDVFSALANNGGRKADGELLYRQIFDSYASADLATISDAVHCGDETTNGEPTLNGYPITCNRLEAQHVDDIDKFFATAFVNRIDLAPVNGAHCGQQRMIFANPSRGRTFMIVEAQVPNPHPELGIDGCRPLAQFWMDQNGNADPKARGALLAQAFLTGGVPGLSDAGFGPFMVAENLTVGSGQIRTNQFDDKPWMLREFKLALDGENLRAIPFPVAESPHGALWNENSGLPQGEECRQSFLSALEGVVTDDLSRMSFVVDAACKDSESRNDGSEDYAAQLSPGFRSQIDKQLAFLGSSLSADDVANRARFAGSCIGCHNEASQSFLGNGVLAPRSDDFPQLQESPSPCRDGEPGTCFTTSNALNTVFLPGRLMVLSNLLGVPVVPNPCDGGGGTGGTSGGFGGSTGTAGTFSTGGFATAGTGPIGFGGASDAGGAEPAPVVIIDLPSADAPVEVLQAEDAQIREEYGDVTISGKSAKSTH